MGPEPEAHRAREMAESFGVDPERYDRARPPYPTAMYERLLAAMPGRDVLDVGIGSGIDARAFRDAGCRVLGVEPDPRMAAYARHTGFEVEVATIEDWDPAGRTFDALAAGQSWHWVDPVAGAVRAAEVLRPGGLLALFWNVGEPPADVAAAFASVYEQVMPGGPASRMYRSDQSPVEGYATGIVAKAAAGIRTAGGFGEPEDWRTSWDRAYIRDAWLEEVRTFGLFTRMPDGLLDTLLTGLGEALDALGGGFTMRYTTLLLTAVRA